VELAPILCVKVSCCLQGHHLVERELTFVACSPENRVSFVALVAFVVPYLSNVDVLPVTRKELQEYILVLRLLLSFTCTFTYIVIASLLATLGKFT
jgi:hypothetical protein